MQYSRRNGAHDNFACNEYSGIRTIARMDTVPKDTIPNEHLPSY